MDKGQSSRPADCGGFTIASQHAYFERWLSNLEKHYDARLSEIKDATATALIAVKEQTAAAFAANKEAVTKTEEGQRAYNAQHNDLTRKMEAQAARFVDRERLEEYEKRFDGKLEGLKVDIGRLQEAGAAGAGRLGQQQEHRQTAQWGVGQAVYVLLSVLGYLVAIGVLFWKAGKP
jgi:hypothetical protein